jgi:DNA-binding NarL/FixJ family response regulator
VVPRTVLIVDDHATFRASARRMLEADGYTVCGEAADGAAALDAVLALAPDLVLLDVALPDLDGFEIARHVTARPGAPAVVLTSSRDWSEDSAAIVACGACGFVTKDALSGAVLAELAA